MFKKGDKVKIRKDSMYYGEHKNTDPADVIGTIFKVVDDEFCYQVQWPNGANNYTSNDLELVDTIQITYPIY